MCSDVNYYKDRIEALNTSTFKLKLTDTFTEALFDDNIVKCVFCSLALICVE